MSVASAYSGCQATASRFRARLGDLPALALGLLFFVASSGFAIAQHVTLHTRARDMGIYVQVLWNAAQGRPLLSSLLQENTNHLAEHVALALWPLVPPAGLVPDAVQLLLLQQFFLAACGLPVYLVARARLGRRVAVGMLLGFYLMPAMSRVSLSEFHPIVLAALPVAGGVACAVLGRPRSAAQLLLLALLFEEEVAPSVAGLGLMLMLAAGCVQRRGGETARRRDGALALAPSRRLALSLVALGLVWAALVILVILPGFRFRPSGGRGEAPNRATAHYDAVRQDPSLVSVWVFAERGPDALAALVLPSGGLLLLAPEVLLAGLPSFTALFLQDRAGTYAGHWAAPLLPIVWLAVAVGLDRVASRPALVRIGLAGVLAGTALAYPLDSFFPGGREFESDHYQISDVERDLRRAVERVPPGASLVATRRVVPQLAARRDLFQFPFSFYNAPLRPDAQRQDVYLLDLTDSPTRRAVEPSEADSVLEKRPRYHVQRFGADVLLLSHARPEPSLPRAEVFAGTVRLLGIDGPFDEATASAEPVVAASGSTMGRWVGGPVALRLYWEALRKPDGEPARVVRLYGPDGAVVAETVGQPLDEYLPLRDWDRGQVVAEDVALSTIEPPRAGTYRLVVGWRQPDGQALAVDGSGGWGELELARLERP